jgi:hypothetical protein
VHTQILLACAKMSHDVPKKKTRAKNGESRRPAFVFTLHGRAGIPRLPLEDNDESNLTLVYPIR